MSTRLCDIDCSLYWANRSVIIQMMWCYLTFKMCVCFFSAFKVQSQTNEIPFINIVRLAHTHKQIHEKHILSSERTPAQTLSLSIHIMCSFVRISFRVAMLSQSLSLSFFLLLLSFFLFHSQCRYPFSLAEHAKRNETICITHLTIASYFFFQLKFHQMTK